jgi:hypothetical protein
MIPPVGWILGYHSALTQPLQLGRGGEPTPLTCAYISHPTAPDRFWTIYVENAGYQSEPCIVSATKLADYNLSITNQNIYILKPRRR